MSLIKCPECNKEVSDKAIACPNCGLPIINQIPPTLINNSELLKFPNLSSNLHIGKQIVNWGGDSAFNGEYEKGENVIEEIPSGKIKVFLHTHGIKIANDSSYTLLDIHNSQIISFKQTTKSELVNMDKSVIGRAVLGGLILGPLGAVIGGMSGIGTKQKFQDKSYLIINYWNVSTKNAQTLLISGDNFNIQSFINRNKQEDRINHAQGRKAENESAFMPIMVLLTALLLVIAFIYFLFILIF